MTPSLTVPVHKDDRLRSLLSSVAESGAHGSALADVGRVLKQHYRGSVQVTLDYRSCPVGRAIVDEHNATDRRQSFKCRDQLLKKLLYVPLFVVNGDDYEALHRFQRADVPRELRSQCDRSYGQFEHLRTIPKKSGKTE